MEEKVSEQKTDQKSVKKKIYTPPMLTVYGKFTELTAGGTMGSNEGSMTTDKTRRP